MATMVQIDDNLAEVAKTRAGLTGRSLSQFVEDAVASELLSRPLDVRTGDVASGPVSIPVFGGDGVVDGLTLAEAVARADLEADRLTALGEGATVAAG
jgi:hypothetical protein